MSVEPSPTVAAGCGWCGGNPNGFMRYDTAHRHADWCPTNNPAMRAAFAPQPNAASLRAARHAIVVARGHRFAQLRAQGWTYAQIAAQAQTPASTVAYAIDAYNYERR